MNSNDDSRTNKNPGKKLFFSSCSSSSESPHNSEYSSENFMDQMDSLQKKQMPAQIPLH